MTNLVRDDIAQTEGYAPGEQPSDTTTIKLNTNENPYAPSRRVAEAMMPILLEGRLRLYPDPVGTRFRETAAKLHGVHPNCQPHIDPVKPAQLAQQHLGSRNVQHRQG